MPSVLFTLTSNLAHFLIENSVFYQKTFKIGIIVQFYSILGSCFIQDQCIDGHHVSGSCRNVKADSTEACQKMCQDNNQCVAFTFIGPLSEKIYYRNSCCMKTAIMDKSNSKAEAHCISGPKFCVEGRLVENH